MKDKEELNRAWELWEMVLSFEKFLIDYYYEDFEKMDMNEGPDKFVDEGLNDYPF